MKALCISFSCFFFVESHAYVSFLDPDQNIPFHLHTLEQIGHLASCPWRGSPSPEAFAYFPPAAASDLTAAFDARRSELANSSLETRSVVAPSCLTNALAASRDAGTAATDEHSSASSSSSSSSSNTQASPAGAVEVTAATGASVESSQESTSQVAKTLSTDGDSIMALFGWQVATKPGHVSCALCGRCVSLDCDSNNTDPTSAAAADVPTIRATDTLVAEMNGKEGAEACDAGAPQPKRLRLKAPFDVEAAHRWFCPWVRADAAAPPSTASRTMATTTAKGVQGENQPATPGWQRVLKALLAAPPPLQGALTIPGSAQTQEKTSTSSVVSHAEARAALASARAVLRNI